jgi:hypothetical protein
VRRVWRSVAKRRPTLERRLLPEGASIDRDSHFAINSQKQNSERYIVPEFSPLQLMAPTLLIK